MTYAINGITLTLQPTTGRWLAREYIGIDGNGHPVYPGVRSFEINWQAISPSDFNQLQTYFQNLSGTLYATASLPEYGASTYTFKNYSGSVLTEPEVSEFFTENYLDARMIINNIRT